MSRRITTTEAIELPCPPERALPAIWEIANIERCEVKADKVSVFPSGPRDGSYDVSGRFAGVRWHGRFEYELNDHGFHSRTADVPRDRATVEGGFFVAPLSQAASTVIHYEQYVLPGWLVPLAPLIRGYLHWSMRHELRILREMVALSEKHAAANNRPPRTTSRRSA